MAQHKELKETGNVAEYIRVINFDSWKCYKLCRTSFGSVKETGRGYGQKSTVLGLVSILSLLLRICRAVVGTQPTLAAEARRTF